MSDANAPGRAGRVRFRRRLYALLDPSTEVCVRIGKFGRVNATAVVEALLVAVILVNSASLILWTVPGLDAAYGVWFRAIEYGTVGVFLVEYALRLWTAPEGAPGTGAWRQRGRYARSPVALIDAAALLPSAAAALSLLGAGDGFSLSFLLTVRLLTRSVKLVRYFPSGHRLGLAVRRKGSQLLAAVGGLLMMLVIAASLMYFAETEAQPEVFSSIPAAMWWSVVTLTTVGYGDTVPITAVGRALAAVIAVLGIGLFALPAGILSAGLLETEVENKGMPGGPLPPAAGEVCPYCGRPPADGEGAD